jgi:cytidylate kinase
LSDIIAIDGPAGAGKSTVARQLALRLAYTYLDSGAMYRAVAWSAMLGGVSPSDVDALVQIARSVRIEFGALRPDGTQTISVNGTDATAAIRSPEVSNLTSSISTLPELRKVVVDQQRALASKAEHGVVLEGRDIGTVVFPNANLKVYLTASAAERAERRLEELRSRGVDMAFEDVLRDQVERDNRDSTRAASPLMPAADAVLVNTDGRTVDEVVQTIRDLHTGSERDA